MDITTLADCQQWAWRQELGGRFDLQLERKLNGGLKEANGEVQQKIILN